jgi:predicted transcriptional regulator
MAARALALFALSVMVASSALAGVTAAQEPVPLPTAPQLPWLPLAIPQPAGVPNPIGAPGLDGPSQGLIGPPTPNAPGFVGPDGDWNAATLVVGSLGAMGVATLAVWGGTRFRTKDEILEHELRSRIYAYVQQHVGASLKDITEALGLSTTNAVWHLRKLEDGGLVRGRKFNGAKIYYPTSGGVQARNLSIASAALTNGNARIILAFVQEHPGAHQREVARVLAVNHGTVRWHLKKLRDAELLEERRSGDSATYHVTPLGGDALRMLAERGTAELAPAPLPDPSAMTAAGQA